jgi:undecaprenyl diphosphate synthase
LTVFGFSTENWIRPRAEVRHILGLHSKLFGRVQELNELNVRIQWIGRPFDAPDARTPKYVQRAIRKAIADTAGNTGMLLTVAFDYGARQELMDAVRRVRAAGVDVTTSAIAEHLYLPELPPVDVLVRTSGEQRVSNFLLWQSAGAAIHFTDKPWPEFDAAELDAALALVG